MSVLDCTGCNWTEVWRDDWLPGWILIGMMIMAVIILFVAWKRKKPLT